MEIQQNITQTEGALMFSLRNQFSPCICLSLSFSVPFNSLLSLSHLFFFSVLVQPLSIVWVGWRSTLGGLQTLLFAVVTVAILRDPEHTEGSLGAKRRRSLPYNQTGSKVARGQLSQRKCEDSWERRGAWSETETSVWWTGLVCGNSGGGLDQDQTCFHDIHFQWNLFKWNQLQSNNGMKERSNSLSWSSHVQWDLRAFCITESTFCHHELYCQINEQNLIIIFPNMIPNSILSINGRRKSHDQYQYVTNQNECQWS